MNLTFRTATQADIETIAALGHKIWLAHYPGIISMEQIRFMLAERYSPGAIAKGMHKGEKYYMAFDGERPVALAGLEEQEHAYFLHKFYVDVARHRQGVGQYFFNFLLSEATTAKPMRLQVNRQNYKAINFYFKAGFSIEAVGDFDIGGGYFMNDFIMVRQPQIA